MKLHWAYVAAPNLLLVALPAAAETAERASSAATPEVPTEAAVRTEPASDAELLPAEMEAPRESLSLATSLVTPIFGAYYLEANIRLADHWGLLVNASSLVLDNAEWNTHTGTVGAGVTYNWKGRGLRGWYTEVVGEIMFSSWEHEPSGREAPIVLGYTGIVATGYRFIWDAGPMLDVGAGFVALHFPSAKVAIDGETVASRPMTKYYPAVKAAVGWAF